MKAASAAERFEDATRLRRQINALEHIRDISLIKGEHVSSGGGVRIEAFDVAHTGGSETVAVMTVVDNGETRKATYRKFKIRSATNDDVASLKEALSRGSSTASGRCRGYSLWTVEKGKCVLPSGC